MATERAPQVHLGLQALQAPLWTRHRGFARYVREHALLLLRKHSDLIGGLVLDAHLDSLKELADFCGHGNTRIYSVDTPSPAVEDGAALMFHAMSPTFPWGPLETVYPSAFRGDSQLIVTLYDLIPLIYPDFYLNHPSVKSFYRTRYRLVQEADCVLSLSETTKQDAVRLLGVDPNRVVVVYGAVSDYFTPSDVSREELISTLRQQIPELKGPFVLSILFTDEFGKRKNLEGAIEGFAQLPADIRNSLQLVLVGHGFNSDYVKHIAYARKHGVEDRVVFPGLVDDELFRELYRACELFIFPTFYEGLGLPILEAMRCGAPVITSDRSSTKELVEIAEARFDPDDASDIRRAMERALVDAQYQSDLRRYGLERSQEFTWQRVADLTAEAYRRTASSSTTARPIGRARTIRMAFCAPSSSLSEHSFGDRRLLETLCKRYPVRVDLVTDPPPSNLNGDGRIEPVTSRQFRWLAERSHYDAIVYRVGGSAHYDPIYELLKHHPGTVWFHDIRLTGLYRRHFERAGWDLTRLPPELAPWASHYPEYPGDLLIRDEFTQHDQGIFMAGEVAGYARRIIVGSGSSKELICLDARPSVAVSVVPEPAVSAQRDSAAPANTIRRKYGIDSRSPILLTVGPITRRKGPETLVDALVILRHNLPEATLAFVGQCEEAYRREIQERASQRGVAENVLFTGFVNDNELDGWLLAADCGLQLCFPTNGESSAAIARCLASGVPTIVSDHGPSRELPGDAVVKVPAPVESPYLAESIQRVVDSQTSARLREGALRYAESVSLDAVADRFWAEAICPGRI